jgi:hypothetical protein
MPRRKKSLCVRNHPRSQGGRWNPNGRLERPCGAHFRYNYDRRLWFKIALALSTSIRFASIPRGRSCCVDLGQDALSVLRLPGFIDLGRQRIRILLRKAALACFPFSFHEGDEAGLLFLRQNLLRKRKNDPAIGVKRDHGRKVGTNAEILNCRSSAVGFPIAALIIKPSMHA